MMGDESMYCSQCGKKLEDESKFCSNCGMPVKGQEDVIEINQDDTIKTVQNEIVQSEDETKTKGETGQNILTGVIIILLIPIAILAASINMRTCDWCDEKFFGSGYYDAYDADSTICKECAMEYYAPFPYENYKK